MTWASWFSGYFILHISQRSFPNFGLKILLCFVFSQKSLELSFFLILFSVGIYLLKDWLKRSQNGTNRNNKFFFTFRDDNSYKRSSFGVNFFRGLHITCKTYYNLSFKAGNYQLDSYASLM